MKNQLEWIMKHLAFTMDQSPTLSQSPQSEMQGEQCGTGCSCTGQADPTAAGPTGAPALPLCSSTH